MSNSQLIASADLDAARAGRLLEAIAGGEDIGEVMQELGEDFGGDDDASGDEDIGEDFGADVSTVLEAVASGDDFGAEEMNPKDLSRLLQVAMSGDDEMGRRRARAKIKKTANKARARGFGKPSARRPGPALTPGRGLATQLAAQARAGITGTPGKENQMTQGVTKDLARVLARQIPGEGPYTPLGIVLPTGITGTVLAGGTATCTVKPSRDVILLGLVVWDEIADYFFINRISAGNDPIFASEDPIPCSAFKANSRWNKLPRRLVPGGIDIKVELVNRSSAAQPFGANFFVDEGDVSERLGRQMVERQLRG
jgi:hypothetical protein